jgi:hypothetical protein
MRERPERAERVYEYSAMTVVPQRTFKVPVDWLKLPRSSP